MLLSNDLKNNFAILFACNVRADKFCESKFALLFTLFISLLYTDSRHMKKWIYIKQFNISLSSFLMVTLLINMIIRKCLIEQFVIKSK